MKVAIYMYGEDLAFENVKDINEEGEWLLVNGDAAADFVQVGIRIKEIVGYRTENE
jgi:hypothetical protein